MWRDDNVVDAARWLRLYSNSRHGKVEVECIYMCVYIYLYFLLSPLPFFLSLVPYHRRSCSVGHVAPSLLAHRRTTKNHHPYAVHSPWTRARPADDSRIPTTWTIRYAFLPPRNKDNWVKSAGLRELHTVANFSLLRILGESDRVTSFCDISTNSVILCTREKRAL